MMVYQVGKQRYLSMVLATAFAASKLPCWQPNWGPRQAACGGTTIQTSAATQAAAWHSL
jgi:hypothetical protein